MLYVICTDVDPVGRERLCHFLFLYYMKNVCFSIGPDNLISYCIYAVDLF